MRFESPRPPVEIADEVELYARQSDRHATLHFIPLVTLGNRVIAGTWMARFTLRSDDKRILLYQEGKIDEPPTEDVWFHVADPESPNGFRPLDILQMGVTGVREFLDRGNLLSGRGEFTSLEDQLLHSREHNRQVRTKHRAEQKALNRLAVRDKRRWWLKIPFLRVGIDLKNKAATAPS
jgi:hypothetical protein